MVEIDSTECRRLRELANLRDSLVAVSDETDLDYNIVHRHVRGLCEHSGLEIDPLPPTEERHGDVSEGECERMRDLYFDERYTLSELAEEFDCAETTALRHVRFRCPHYLPTEKAWGGNTVEPIGVGGNGIDWQINPRANH